MVSLSWCFSISSFLSLSGGNAADVCWGIFVRARGLPRIGLFSAGRDFSCLGKYFMCASRRLAFGLVVYRTVFYVRQPEAGNDSIHVKRKYIDKVKPQLRVIVSC